jgi:hypothetical protein
MHEGVGDMNLSGATSHISDAYSRLCEAIQGLPSAIAKVMPSR